jgi:hypothetical protein
MLKKQWNLELAFRDIEASNKFWPMFSNPKTAFPIRLRDPHAQDFVNNAIFRVIGELMEASQELKNKPWKQTQKDVDYEAFKEELIDAWHFMLRLMLITFGWPEDTYQILTEAYAAKAQINQERQEQGV